MYVLFFHTLSRAKYYIIVISRRAITSVQSRVIIVCITVCIRTYLLEYLGVVGWWASWWSAEASSATILVGIELHASTQTSNNLIRRVRYLKLARTNIINVLSRIATSSLAVISPVSTKWLASRISRLDSHREIISVDKTNIIVITARSIKRKFYNS